MEREEGNWISDRELIALFIGGLIIWATLIAAVVYGIYRAATA